MKPDSVPRSDGPRRTLGDLNDFARLVGLMSGAGDPDESSRSLGEALAADLVVVLRGNSIEDSLVWKDPAMSEEELTRKLGGRGQGSRRMLMGSRAVMTVPLRPLDLDLVVSRPDREFSTDECEFATAVAALIGASRAARDSARLNLQMQDDMQLIESRLERSRDALENNQGLLDRLSRIQELIARRPPIDVLLESVVTSASYLIDADAVDLHLRDTGIGGDTRADSIWDDPTTARVATTAMQEDRLAIIRDDNSSVVADRPSSYAHALAAPIRVSGRIVGCMVAARFSKDCPFSSSEHESMIALALHASIALQDARAVDAMRMSLDRERHRSEHDHLTGLPNRVTILERLEHRLENVGTVPIMVMFVDIDDFKMTNDELGHRAGDEALVVVADRIRSAVRTSDLVGRIAADEFVVVCGGMSELGAMELARRIQDQVALPMRLSGRDHLLTVSIGIAGASTTDSAEKVIANADLAAGRAKQSGRSSMEVFDVELRRLQRKRVATQVELRSAISANQLRVFLQPVVSLPERRVVSFEALARWQHPRRGLILPDDFIPLAEESDLVREIDHRIIESTLKLMSGRDSPLPVAVNVSARTLADPGLADWFRARFDEYGVDPGMVVVELTETVLLSPTRITMTQLDQLRSQGVRVILDDFGTGYSSLSTLQNFDVDGVKIDRSFVSILGEDARARAIVSAVFHMAAAMGLVVVAEGVETDAQAELLVRLRDDSGEVALAGQGYLFGRPAEGLDVISGFLPLLTGGESTS